MDSLAETLVSAWARHFPRREGYVSVVERLEGPMGGVRLRVQRGDFRAQADVVGDLAQRNGTAQPSIVLKSSAHSDRVDEAMQIEQRQEAALAAGGAISGLAVFGYLSASVLWGVLQPMLVIMALFVLAVFLPLGGFNFGYWLGERIGTARRNMILFETVEDSALQQDLRRWRALARQLSVERRSLTRGARELPFRRAQA